jgi:hypothetical protein
MTGVSIPDDTSHAQPVQRLACGEAGPIRETQNVEEYPQMALIFADQIRGNLNPPPIGVHLRNLRMIIRCKFLSCLPAVNSECR